MVNFTKWLLFKEEVLRNINLAKAIKRSGINPALLQHAKGVMTINQFMENPPHDIEGGYALGLSKASGIPHIYWELAALHRLTNWEDAYKGVFGSNYWQRFNEPDVTTKFMNNITGQPKNIVFFVPPNPSNLGRYTREELEYLTQHPEKASNVYFVFGTYDVVSPEDYQKQILGDKDPNQASTAVQSILANPSLHRKPEEF